MYPVKIWVDLEFNGHKFRWADIDKFKYYLIVKACLLQETLQSMLMRNVFFKLGLGLGFCRRPLDPKIFKW